MNRYPTSRPAPAVPPDFVIWNSVPPQERVGWVRHCFGSELDKRASSTARGLGIREQMSNANVQRPIGTGDWLLMCFHEPAQFEPKSKCSAAAGEDHGRLASRQPAVLSVRAPHS